VRAGGGGGVRQHGVEKVHDRRVDGHLQVEGAAVAHGESLVGSGGAFRGAGVPAGVDALG
jgi:hypothetical protein